MTAQNTLEQNANKTHKQQRVALVLQSAIHQFLHNTNKYLPLAHISSTIARKFFPHSYPQQKRYKMHPSLN
jgi:hypothetical protein